MKCKITVIRQWLQNQNKTKPHAYLVIKRLITT